MCGVMEPGLASTWPRSQCVLLDTTQEHANVVASNPFLERLVEHFDAGDDRLARLRRKPNDLAIITHLDDTTLDSAGTHGAAPLDRENVFDCSSGRACRFRAWARECRRPAPPSTHRCTCRRRHPQDSSWPPERRRETTGSLSPGNSYFSRSSRTSISTRSSSSSSSTRSILLRNTNDGGNVHLAGQQNVLPRLRHRPVRRVDDEDGANHLGGASDHVLDVIRHGPGSRCVRSADSRSRTRRAPPRSSPLWIRRERCHLWRFSW